MRRTANEASVVDLERIAAELESDEDREVIRAALRELLWLRIIVLAAELALVRDEEEKSHDDRA